MTYTPGNRYMTKQGEMWTCVTIDEQHVYLQTRPGTPAYVWTLDGTSVSLYSAGAGYDLVIGYEEAAA